MFKLKSLLSVLCVIAGTFANASHATVIDFNGLAGTNLAGNSSVFNSGAYHLTYLAPNTSVTVSGFQFVNSLYMYAINSGYGTGSDSSGNAYNGTDFLMGMGTFTMTNAAHTPFSLNSIDMKDWAGNVATATLTGTLAGGGTVTTTVNLDQTSNATKQTGNDFLTYALTGFSNLTSLSISHNTNNMYYLAIDNIVVNAAEVPEPASLGLLGLGLAALGAIRRRKK